MHEDSGKSHDSAAFDSNLQPSATCGGYCAETVVFGFGGQS